MRYNSERRIALGGVCGSTRWQGKMNDAAAMALVLGQYFGSGKNPRFGLGFWRIPELAQVRKIFLI